MSHDFCTCDDLTGHGRCHRCCEADSYECCDCGTTRAYRDIVFDHGAAICDDRDGCAQVTFRAKSRDWFDEVAT